MKYGGDTNVISGLCEISSDWTKFQDESLFAYYASVVNKFQMKKICIWWYENYALRRLKLLGLTMKQIEACKMQADDLYKTCIENPYTIPSLSMEKCEEILGRFDKEMDPKDIKCGKIIRKIYSNVVNNASSGISYKALLYAYPDLPEYLSYLQSKYNIHHDYDTLYLDYQYQVETVVAEKIASLLSEECESGGPASFICKTLTDKQKIAIQGALDSNICIITGGAGTGNNNYQ